MDPATISSSTSVGRRHPPGTFELRDPSSNLVTATVTYDAATKTATLVPQSSLGFSTTYTAIVKGGAIDPRVKDARRQRDGGERDLDVHHRRGAAAAVVVPVLDLAGDHRAGADRRRRSRASVVLGTKFRSDIAGYITGARFYKARAEHRHARRDAVDEHRDAAGDGDVHRRDRVGLAAGVVPDAGRDRGEHDLRHLVSRAERPLFEPGQLLRDRRGRQSRRCRRCRNGVDGAERPLQLQHERTSSRPRPSSRRATSSTWCSTRPSVRTSRRRR